MTVHDGSALAASWKQGKQSGDNGLERLTKQAKNENSFFYPSQTCSRGPSARLVYVCVVEHY